MNNNQQVIKDSITQTSWAYHDTQPLFRAALDGRVGDMHTANQSTVGIFLHR